MTPFTPGLLTQSQADALTGALRRLAALEAMTATAPLAINRAGGCVNISLAAAGTPDTEFDAQILARSPAGTPTAGEGNQPLYKYSWREVGWRLIDPNIGPEQVTVVGGRTGVFNLKRNLSSANNATGPRPIAIGQVVRIKPMAGVSGWYETDAVGGMLIGTFKCKDGNGATQTMTWYGRDFFMMSSTFGQWTWGEQDGGILPDNGFPG